MSIPTLFEQLSSAAVQSVPAAKRFNPRPPGVIRSGSASDVVLKFLQESSGFKTEAQIRWKTGLNHAKVSWALLFLRSNGFVDAVPDEIRCGRFLRYRATRKEI
jgi:hypothetical protein